MPCWLHALLTCRLAAADSLCMSGAYMSWSPNARAVTNISSQMLSLCGWTVVHVAVVHVALLTSVFVIG